MTVVEEVAMGARGASLKVLAALIGAVMLIIPQTIGWAQVPAVKPSQIEVVFQVSLDELAMKLPKKLMLYQASPDPIAITQRQALERFFGKAAYFEVAEASGGLFCADLSRLWAKAPRPDDQVLALGAQEIRTIAERFLAQIGGMPGEKIVVYTSTDTMEFVDTRGQRRTLPVGYNMTCRRLVDGYEVVGPGGKIKVFLDLSGQVAGYLRVWRRLVPLREEPLITIHQAADKFKTKPLGNVLLADVKKVEVKGIKLVYFELGMYERQRYLQPAYEFQCVAYVEGDGKIWQVPYTVYIEALQQLPEPLWPSGPQYEPGGRPSTMPKAGED